MTIRALLHLAALAAFAVLALPSAAQAQPYSSGPYQYDQNSGDYITGRIATSQPYNVWLGGNNGLHVRLHGGTVIAPTGTRLQSGMRVRIWGSWNGDGTFEANQIDVLPDSATVRRYPNDPYGTGAYGPGPNRYGPNYNPNSPYQGPNYNPNSSYQGYMTGYVSSFQPYNLWLGRGNTGNLHVTLHDGTVINPIGITLQPNMRVRVWGHWNGNGTFEANQIEVVNPGDDGS